MTILHVTMIHVLLSCSFLHVLVITILDRAVQSHVCVCLGSTLTENVYVSCSQQMVDSACMPQKKRYAPPER
jgi:hypothetical protein